MFAPPPIRFSNKCKRCGLRYPRRAGECVHCKGLSDKEMEEMLANKRRAHVNTAAIGKLFFYIALLILLGFVVLSFSCVDGYLYAASVMFKTEG